MVNGLNISLGLVDTPGAERQIPDVVNSNPENEPMNC